MGKILSQNYKKENILLKGNEAYFQGYFNPK